jgi:hypothetical protein
MKPWVLAHGLKALPECLKTALDDVVEFVILRRRLDELMPVELGDEFLRFGDALLLLEPLQFAFRGDF